MAIWDILADLKESAAELKDNARDLMGDVTSLYTETNLEKTLGNAYPAGIADQKERISLAMMMDFHQRTGIWESPEYDGWDDLESCRDHDYLRSVSHVRPEDAERLYRQGLGYLNRQEYRPAAAVFRALAMQGHAGSQYYLGWMYRNGFEVDEDIDLAKEWFEKAAAGGFTEAYTMLGHYCRQNSGTDTGLLKSYEYYKKAYEGGSRAGTFCYGLCHEYGIGTDKNLDTAAALYEKAAAMGDADARERLEKLLRQKDTGHPAAALRSTGAVPPGYPPASAGDPSAGRRS